MVRIKDCLLLLELYTFVYMPINTISFNKHGYTLERLCHISVEISFAFGMLAGGLYWEDSKSMYNKFIFYNGDQFSRFREYFLNGFAIFVVCFYCNNARAFSVPHTWQCANSSFQE